MASAAEIKSHRLNWLLRSALNGATVSQLRLKCRGLGVSKTTEDNYIRIVLAKIQIKKEKRF